MRETQAIRKRISTLATNAWRRLRGPQTLGARGERAAARFLKRRGYKIVAHGERSRFGELDLVAIERETIVFVEVKTRISHIAGHPTEAIGPEKRRKLTQLALVFLKRHDLLEYRARFDVVAITWPKDARRPVIEHFENAFEPVGEGQMFS